MDCELLLLERTVKNGEYQYIHLLYRVDLPIKSKEARECAVPN